MTHAPERLERGWRNPFLARHFPILPGLLAAPDANSRGIEGFLRVPSMWFQVQGGDQGEDEGEDA